MTEPTVNVPLLRKVVEWAEAEAAKPWELREWNQVSVIQSPERITGYHDERGYWVEASKAPSCGTNYCIAGYVAQVTLREGERVGFGWDIVDPNGQTVDGAVERAAEMLGIDAEVAMGDGLFAGGNTIEDVRRIAESIAGERL